MQFERVHGNPEVLVHMGEKIRFEYYGDPGEPPVRATAWKEEVDREGSVSESCIADLRQKWASRTEAEDAIMKAAKIALSAR